MPEIIENGSFNTEIMPLPKTARYLFDFYDGMVKKHL